MRFTLLLILISLLFTSISYSFQSTIQGKVTHSETKEALAGASVYLAGTTFGTSTDSGGFYSFQAKIEGKLMLVVSLIGSKSKNKEITLVKGDNQNHNFELDDDTLLLNEIYVSDKVDSEWQRLYDAYVDFFIGEDMFARKTEILNPFVIDFDPIGESSYRVSYREPLKVLNNSLGFEIEIEMEKSEFNVVNNTGYWLIYPRYNELESENRRQRQIWDANKRNAYIGSSNHFFKSLNENRMRSNQFYVYPHNRSISRVTDPTIIRQAFPQSWNKIVDSYYVYEIVDPNFGVAHNPRLNRNGGLSDFTQLNKFDIQNPYGLIITDKFGNIINAAEVFFLGSWADDRFSKNLPFNFD